MPGNKTMNDEGGHPMLLYFLSKLNGKQDKIVDVDVDELHEWEEECLFKEEYHIHMTVTSLKYVVSTDFCVTMFQI